ncbi:MAG TPA: O-antigen ligase family protein [Candidatus Angelobacter sp.]|nr:O-antigen ligase family protein [Candidatus Angelobacter sp.]
MHFGLEQYVPLALYFCAMIVFLLSLFWRPQVGLYFLVPLLPLQTIRYRIIDLPLGNKLIDILLLGVILGAIFKGYRFEKTPMNKLLLLFGIFCYLELWRGAFYLKTEMPLSINDPRFSNWKNYMVMFIIFAVVVNVIKNVKQLQILVVLMCLSVLAVDKGYYSTMSGRDISHFSYEARDGGPLGYAGVNGVATFEAEFMIFLLGVAAYQKRKSLKAGVWVLVVFSCYCLMISFSREAYAGILISLLFLGLLKQRWLLIPLAVFLFSWQSFVPVAVQERVNMTYDKTDQQLDSSAEDRVKIWDDAMYLFQQDPVFGDGFDTYRFQHRVSIYTDTHNYFLKVLVEMGALGLLFFLFLLAKATRLGLKLWRSAQDPFLKSIGLGFALLMACVFVVNFFGDRWLYIEVNGFLWVLLACVVRGQIIANQSMMKAEAAGTVDVPSGEPQFAEEEPVLA